MQHDLKRQDILILTHGALIFSITNCFWNNTSVCLWILFLLLKFSPMIYFLLAADPTKRYPDWNSSFETFANAYSSCFICNIHSLDEDNIRKIFIWCSETLELETLGPLVTLAPNASTELIEYWSLHDNIQTPSQWTDAELDKIFLPLLKKGPFTLSECRWRTHAHTQRKKFEIFLV
jgi:hypothetical protein